MTDDNAAFRRELVALLPRLRRFAMALAGARDVAEDLLQTAVEKALRNWTSFDKGRRLDSWVFKIMQNVWLDMKRASVHAPVFTDEPLDMIGEDGRDVVAARQELRIARNAYAELPEDQKAVLALVVLEGMTYAEAAAAMDVPIGTVMSRLARARAAIAAKVNGGVLGPVREKS
ncbi:MAG: RNA polymerase sigma factor [Terricaulis sp.]